MIDRTLGALRDFFSTPARQAAAWVALGVAGLALAAGGVLLFTGGNSGSKPAGGDAATPTSTRAAITPTPTPTATSTPTPTPTATPTPAVTPTQVAARQPIGGNAGGGSSNPAPAAAEPAPTPEEAPAPAAPGGPYCDTISSSTPPNSVFGLLTIGGADAPAGTVVSLAFDGVAGPGRPTAEAGGYKVNWSAGGEACANRVGAAISVVVNGQLFPTGATVGGGSPALRADVAVP